MGLQALCWGLAAPAPASEKASAYSLPGHWVTLQDAETHEESGSSKSTSSTSHHPNRLGTRTELPVVTWGGILPHLLLIRA